jgi:hypothetical protein
MASGMSDRLRQGGDLLGQQPAAEEGSPGLLQKFVPLGTPPAAQRLQPGKLRMRRPGGWRGAPCGSLPTMRRFVPADSFAECIRIPDITVGWWEGGRPVCAVITRSTR